MDPNTAALALIQKCVGPDNKINDISIFYDALVKALVDARADGEQQAAAETLTEVIPARSDS